MNIQVEKITDYSLLKRAVEFVFGGEIKAPLVKWYRSRHSPCRTQMFAVFCRDVPYSVVMQLRTHDKNGALFLVEPGRPDTGTERAKAQNGNYRDQPRNLFMLLNAEHLIVIAQKRLCMKAEDKTRHFMEELREKVREVDEGLASQMMRPCEYCGGICREFKPCGYNLTLEKKP